MVLEEFPHPRRAGSLHGLPESLALLDSIRTLDEKRPLTEEYEFKGVIIDMTLVMDVLDVVGKATKAAIDPFLREYAEDHDIPIPPFSIQEDYLATYAALSSRQRVQKCLEVRGVDLEFGSLSDDASVRTVCGLDAAYRSELMRAISGGIPRKEQSVSILQQLKTHGCRLAVWYNGHHGKHLLRAARLHSLFDTLVDGAVVEKFDLRQAPEPDIILKCCTGMGVSPYESILICAYGYHGCSAGATANLGLILGCYNDRDPLEPSSQEEELYKEGADLVADISELTCDVIADTYTRHISEDPWRLSYRAFLPSDERLREAMTSVGNGYIGNRAAWEGARISKKHYPATYLAPMYDTAPSEVKGRTVYNSDMVNIPNWVLVEFRIGDGPWISPFDDDMQIVAYSHSINMRHAALQRSITFRDPQGRQTTIETVRIASMHAYHTCALQYTVIPENYTAALTIRSSIDGDVINDNVARYSDLTRVHLTDYTTSCSESCNGILMQCRTIYSNVGLALFAKHTLWVDEVETPCTATYFQSSKSISADFVIADAQRGRSYTIEKLVAIFSSLDAEVQAAPDHEDYGACLSRLAVGELQGITYFAQLFEHHKRAWADIWDKSDIIVEGDRFVQTMIRAHTYHLMITASPHRTLVDAGLPARGLCGEGYRGHVFWDEVYMFPFYLSKFPEVAKAHLQYRIKRLPQAREYAHENGYTGAMFPWQTSDTGNEETQVVHYNPVSGEWDPDDSCRQRHVSIAIFLDAWRYWHETRDKEFLENGGLAEMMLDIALFWSSIAKFDEMDGKYHIAGVMGPDEFHECSKECGHGVKDNAYTNIMVLWVFQKVQELLKILSPEVSKCIQEKIGLTDEVLHTMEDMQTKMNVEIQGGIVQQFAGYHDLKELDWSLYRKKYKSVKRIDRILKAEGLSPDDYKVAKQPDFLMIYYLITPAEISSIFHNLGIDIGDETAFLRRNYDYYLARTSHGSTLSFTVMAKIAQLCGRADFEWEWFMEAAKSDIYDRQGTTHEGIHCAVMAGTIDIIISNFVGLRESMDSSYHIRPTLPKHWQSITFKRQLCGQWYEFLVTKKDVKITLVDGASSDEPTGPFYIGNSKIMVCPWSPITVEYNTIVTMKNFVDLMWRTKFVRQSIVDSWFDGIEPHSSSVGVLRYALQSLSTAPKGDLQLCQLVLEKRKRVSVEMNYEISSLQKDLVFLLKGDEEFFHYLSQQPGNEDFDNHVAAGTAFLGQTKFMNFITDRDGTINMYCGRYLTSIQAVYNAIFLTTFAKTCCENAMIMTSAPLQGLRDVSVLPDGVFYFSCSKGKEFLTRQGLYLSAEVSPEGQRLMQAFNKRMHQLLKRPEYEKFALLGSGFQVNLGQATVARSDHARTIPQHESDAFLDVVRQIAQEVSGGKLLVSSTEYDIEVAPADEDAKSRQWTKGDGLQLADRRLTLSLATGPNLVCGDALSDVPMAEVAMQHCPHDTRCIFVTTDRDLQAIVQRVCPQSLFVPSPDILVSILYQTARHASHRSAA